MDWASLALVFRYQGDSRASSFLLKVPFLVPELLLKTAAGLPILFSFPVASLWLY